MRWHFGGNLQPVRLICEYDWKECPIAVISYIWSEIVTDVVDGLTGEGQLWRILGFILLCSMLFHTVYYKMRWVNKNEHDSTRDHLIKVGFKMQDLELKVNILTYKMQYGIWPMLDEIPTHSLNELKNVKLTLSSDSKQDMWAKHHLHRYISKYIQNSENDKWLNQHLLGGESMELAQQKFLSQFQDGNINFDPTNSPQLKLKLLQRENGSKDYERLIKATGECQKYMDEINESNKSLGLFDNSSDISDQISSAQDICLGTKSDQDIHNFLVDPKKWHEIYRRANKTAAGFNENNKNKSNLKFPAVGQRCALKSSKNRSKLLPPGLSITFLSDKFKTLPSSELCVAADGDRPNMRKHSTNETLNMVKEKLESWHDIKNGLENTTALDNADKPWGDKKSSEIALPVKTSMNINSFNSDRKRKTKNMISSNIEKKSMRSFDKLNPDECDGSITNESNSTSINSAAPVERLPARCVKLPSEQNRRFMHQNMNISSSNSASEEYTLDSNMTAQITADAKWSNVEEAIESPWKISRNINRNSPSSRNNTANGASQIAARVKDLTPESDSSATSNVNQTSAQKNVANPFGVLVSNVNINSHFIPNENVVEISGNLSENGRSMENNINLYAKGEIGSILQVDTGDLLLLRNEPVHQISMETDEDTTFVSQNSSQTELLKDSDTDAKSTTTLLQEALEFKKVLLMQMANTNDTYDEKGVRNESSENDSDDTCRSKTDNRFRSKILDIISEEQSAGSSTEKTSRTYLLSRAINETNLCKSSHITSNEHINCDQITPENECCTDFKSLVTATSSEYFSSHNITDNEPRSGQILNERIADEDGLRSPLKSCSGQGSEERLAMNDLQNQQNNIITQSFDIEFKKVGSQYIPAKQWTIPSADYTQPWQTNDKNSLNSSSSLNELEEVAANRPDIDKNAASFQELSQKSVQKVEKSVVAIPVITTNKSETDMEFLKSLSSVDSEQAMSWNFISQSSSNESISVFMNALVNLDSKNINEIAEEKFKMLDSTDFDSQSQKQSSVVLLSDTDISKHRPSIVGEILEMIADTAIFKLEKPGVHRNTLTSTYSEGLNLLKSHGILSFDHEKLQRKQEIFSKLRTLDAFMKPLECNSESNSEQHENDGDASPLTDRTVVCISNADTPNITKTVCNRVSDAGNHTSVEGSFESSDAETVDQRCNRQVLNNHVIVMNGNKMFEFDARLGIPGENKLPQTVSDHIDLQTESKESNKTEADLSTRYRGDDANLGKERDELDAKNSCESNNVDLESRNITLNSKKSRLSKSSITNFSTETSDSYFDVSNHDFAVSSVILTSQNSNFVACRIAEHEKSDTSSYADASDYSSKLPSHSSSLQSNAMKNPSAGKNSCSESRVAHTNSEMTEETNLQRDEIDENAVVCQNNIESKHESLSTTQLKTKRTELHVSKTEPLVGSKEQDTSKCCSSANLDKNNSQPNTTLLSKGKIVSKSGIPILKSRIETPRREKSLDAKTRSRSPVRRASTPISKCLESNSDLKTNSVANASETQVGRAACATRTGLHRKQSYTLPTKTNNIRQEDLEAKPDSTDNEESKISQSLSRELAATPEKCNLNASENLAKECTVIYINIISDSDRNEAQVAEAKEIDERGTKLDTNCQSLSLRSLRPGQSNQTKYAIDLTSPISDGDVCKDVLESLINGNGKTLMPLGAAQKEGSDPQEIKPQLGIVHTTANKLLSTSTLQLSRPLRVEQREIEVSVKPSVKNTSTSVSDFPETSLEGNRSFCDPTNEVFDVSKEMIPTDPIVLSETVTADPNFFECKKIHRLYNKLGLGFQEQPE